MFGPPPLPIARLAIRRQARGALPQNARLHALPQILVNDAELRHVRHHQCARFVDPLAAPPGGRVFHIAEPVPHPPPDIERIAEQSVLLRRPPADGVVVPDAASRSGDVLRVECLGDGAGTDATGECLENAPHDRRLCGIDLPQSAIEVAVGREFANNPIAIGWKADGAAAPDHPLLAAMRLLGKVFQEPGIHHALEGDMQVVDPVVGQGDDPGTGIDHQLVQAGDMLEVAGKAIQALRQYDIHTPLPQRGQHGLITRAKNRCPGDGVIGEHLRHLPVLFVRAGAADADLIVDGGLALQVGTEPRVDGGAHHDVSILGSCVRSRKIVPIRRDSSAIESCGLELCSVFIIYIGQTSLCLTLPPYI